MEESTRIEQSKFAVGADPPAIDAGDLCWAYGENRITAMVLDPDSAYLYWEVTDEGIAAARGRLGPGGQDAWCNLRVYDTTGCTFDGTNANDYLDIQVERSDRDYFVRVRRPTSSMHAEIGMKSREGFYQPIARSGRVDFPRTQPSSDTHLEWMTVTSDAPPPSVAPYRSRYSGPEPRLPARGGEGYPDVWRASPATPTPYLNHVVRHSIPGSMWATHRTVGQYGIEHAERWWRIDEWRAEWRSGLRFFRWERLDPQRVVVELLGERPQDVAIEGGGMVVYGPWRVTIRGFEQEPGRRVLATWSMRWVRATTPMIERWRHFLERRVFSAYEREHVSLGASEQQRSFEGGASELWQLGGSERMWAGASEWVAAGGSETLWLGASEWAAAGASGALWLGASVQLARGASESISWAMGGSELVESGRSLGASELREAGRFMGASELMESGASESGASSLLGASRLGGASEQQAHRTGERWGGR
jgi:hypothetical protein